MAGEEFITALIKFVADDTQVNEVADKLEERAKTAAQNIDEAFRMAFRRAGGESASFAPQVGGGGPSEGGGGGGAIAPEAETGQFSASTWLGTVTARTAGINANAKATKAVTEATKEATAATSGLSQAWASGVNAVRNWVAAHDEGNKLFRVGAKLSATLSTSLLSHLSPAMGGVAAKMAMVARSTAGLGAGFAVAAGLAIGIAAALGKFIDKAKEAAAFEVKLAQAERYKDQAAAISALIEVQGKQAASAQSFKDIGTGPIRTMLGLIDVLTTSRKALAQAEQDSAAKVNKLWKEYELPQSVIESRKALLAVQGQAIALTTKEAETVEQAAAIARETSDNIKAQAQAEKELLMSRAEQEAAALNGKGLYAKALEKISTAIQQAGLIDLETENKLKKAREDDIRLQADIAAAHVAKSGVIAEAEARLKATRLEGIMAVLEAEREATNAEAERLSQALSGLEEYQKKRREGLADEFSGRRTEEARSAAQKEEEIRIKLNAATGADRIRIQGELEAHLRSREEQITKTNTDETLKRIANARKEAEEAVKASEMRQAARELEDRKAGLSGGHSIARELATLGAQIDDPDATAEKRVAAAERLKARKLKIDEDYFSILRTMGVASAADEVARQTQITNSYKQGTQERLDSEKDLAMKVKALREEAASAGQSLLQKAAGRLAGRGIEFGSMQDLQREIADMQREAGETIRDLSTGGKIKLGGLGEAFATAAEGRARQDKGRTIQDEIGLALSEASRGLAGDLQTGSKAAISFAEALNQATAAISGGTGGSSAAREAGGGSRFVNRTFQGGMSPLEKEAEDAAKEAAAARMEASLAQIRLEGGPDMAQKTDDLLRGAVTEGQGGGQGGGPVDTTGMKTASYTHSNEFVGGWMRSFDEVTVATERFLEGFNNKIQEGSSQMANALFENFMEKVVRRLDDESRRQ